CASTQKTSGNEAELNHVAFIRPPPVVVSNVGFAQPQAVIRDATADVYLVSNVNGNPTEKDDNGFISQVAPDGKVINLKWIDGSTGNTTLHAPKGMAINDKRLFVADIDAVRIFDRTTGAALGVVQVPKATYLTGVSIAANGTLYVTDAGLKPADAEAKPSAEGGKGKKDSEGKPADAKASEPPKVDDLGLTASGTDAIYQVSKNGLLKKLRKNEDLHQPSAVAADNDGVWVASWKQPELYRISKLGKQGDPVKAPASELDGLARLPDGTLLLASWQTKSVYVGFPGGDFQLVADNAPNAGAVGYDSKRRRALIPLQNDNTLVIQELSGFEQDSDKVADQ
ncbi:MAG TPA: hypothetical protein VL137_02775, partial [Polyangiaceae bacterium]|nr:hypothetical protein [Polyangiaceae bacterium]